MRVANGKRSSWVRTIGTADDFAEADGNNVLTFWQAQDKVGSLARADRGGTAEPVTVKQAIDAYEADLKTRGGEVGNVQRIRVHITNALASNLIKAAIGRAAAVQLLRDHRPALRDLQRGRDRSANGWSQRRPGTESSHDSLLEGNGFELSVRGSGEAGAPFSCAGWRRSLATDQG
jgi:hypothetical protein